METTITLFDNRTLQKVFIHEAIMAILKIRKSPIRVGNEKDCRAFLSDVVDYVVKHYSRGLYTTYANIIEALKKYGIYSGIDLIGEINRKRDVLRSLGYRVDIIKDTSDRPKGFKSIGKLNYRGMDKTRTMAVRSKYGNCPVMFYEYEGAVTNGSQINNIKIDYHYATGCKYYDVRPILLDTWLSLPEDKKIATVTVDRSDMEVA